MLAHQLAGNIRHAWSSWLHQGMPCMLSGTMIGIAGVGKGDDILTLPSNMLVGRALQSLRWMRLEAFETTSDGTSALCVPLGTDCSPKSIVYKDGSIAYGYETIGRRGDWVTALAQPPTQEPFYKRRLYVSGVKTPPTPGSVSDSSER